MPSLFRLAPALLLALASAGRASADEGGGSDPLPGLTEVVRRTRPAPGPGFALRYAEGVTALRTERWEDAAVALGRAALEAPTDPRPHLLQAVAHLGLARHDLATRAARRAFAVHDVWGPDDFVLSRVLPPELATAFAARVETELQKSMAERASDPDTAFLLALVQHGAGRRVTARQNVLSLLAAFPDHRPTRQLAAAYAEDGPSRSEWKAVGPGERPEDPMVRGTHFLWTGQPDRAAIAFAEASALDPAAALPRVELGHALFASGRFGLAGRVLLDGLGRLPDPARRPLDLYARFGEAEELDSLLSRLEEHARTHPSDIESLFLYGYALYHTDQPDQALPIFELLVKGRPNDALLATFVAEAKRKKDGGKPPANGAGDPAEARLEAGIAAFRNGGYPEALRLFEEALRLDEAKPQHHFRVALARFAAGRFASAGIAFRQGMEHVQDWKAFAFDWAGAYGDTADYRVRVADLERHVEANQADADSRLFYGVLLFSGKDYQAAIRAFGRNAEADKGDTLSLELQNQARAAALRSY